MTLAVVWLESKPGGSVNLCFASDSRTTPGPIEGINKVLLFSRPDIAAVWAGDFRFASLLASHLEVFFSSTEALRRRDVDVARAFHRAAASITEHLATALSPDVNAREINPYGQEPGQVKMVVGGYSIDRGEFLVLHVGWNPGDQRWKSSVQTMTEDLTVFFGDEPKRAKRAAKEIRRHRDEGSPCSWRMEPLASLQVAVLDKNRPSIGGDLQLAKVFKHGSVRSFGLLHSSGSAERVSVRGSRLGPGAAKDLRDRDLLVDLRAWIPSRAMFGRVNSRHVPAAGDARDATRARTEEPVISTG